MSSQFSVKRRKLNEGNARLTKPFVSPLRANKSEPQAVPTENKENEAVYTAEYMPSTLAHGTRVPSRLGIGERRPMAKTPAATAFTSVRPAGAAPFKSTPIRKQQAYTTSAKKKDPAEFMAERAITSIEMQIRAVKNDIDTLSQAARISSSTTDADLEVLIQKWKSASQAAAEELFGSVKERVNRMGGVAAWRESEKNKYDRSHGLGEFKEEPEGSDDADCEFDSEGEELPEDEQEWRKRQKAQAKKEIIEAADVEEMAEEEPMGKDGKKAVWQENGVDNDEFTMDMMIRSLNIKLGVIGYDKDAQRWVS